LRLQERRRALGDLPRFRVGCGIFSVYEASSTCAIERCAHHRSQLVHGCRREALLGPELQEQLEAAARERRHGERDEVRALEVEPEAIGLATLRRAAGDVCIEPPPDELADGQGLVGGRRFQAVTLATGL
jgi:hypothetical protein